LVFGFLCLLDVSINDVVKALIHVECDSRSRLEVETRKPLLILPVQFDVLNVPNYDDVKIFDRVYQLSPLLASTFDPMKNPISPFYWQFRVL
jgi:hypothetical protein